MKAVFNRILFYPTYLTLILSGFLVNKRKVRPVTSRERGMPSYIEVSDIVGRRVTLTWKHILVLKKKLPGRLRRLINIKFRKGYVERQLALRKGACQMCGNCCCERSCPFLVQSSGRLECILHPSSKPANCSVYPIDKKDVEEYGCKGFWFEEGRTIC